MNGPPMRFKLAFVSVLLMGGPQVYGQGRPLAPQAVSFAGGYGQVEVGGPSVGLGFHHSRPLPSRVSFYTPVANSLDLSTDYWTRDAAPLPLRVTLVEAGQARPFGLRPMPYTWTPASVTFAAPDGGWFATVRYRFGERQPFFVVELHVPKHRPDAAPACRRT